MSRVRKKSNYSFHINKGFQPFHSCFGKITVGMVIPPDTTISVNKKKCHTSQAMFQQEQIAWNWIKIYHKIQ